MATTYHINEKTGNPNICRKASCEKDHFQSKEAALRAKGEPAPLVEEKAKAKGEAAREKLKEASSPTPSPAPAVATTTSEEVPPVEAPSAARGEGKREAEEPAEGSEPVWKTEARTHLRRGEKAARALVGEVKRTTASTLNHVKANPIAARGSRLLQKFAK